MIIALFVSFFFREERKRRNFVCTRIRMNVNVSFYLDTCWTHNTNLEVWKILENVSNKIIDAVKSICAKGNDIIRKATTYKRKFATNKAVRQRNILILTFY